MRPLDLSVRFARVVPVVVGAAFGSLLLLASACEDEGTTSGGTFGMDGGPDTYAPNTGLDASNTSDGGGGGGADSGADAGSVSTQADGRYRTTAWTCGQGGASVDILAFAGTINIQSVFTTISGATGAVDVVHSATCTRTTPLTSIEYPSPGTIKSTAANAYTCSATCAPATCTAGTQPVITDTFSLAGSGGTYTYTRVLGANDLGGVSIQKAAGCQAGDTEVATHVKQ